MSTKTSNPINGEASVLLTDRMLEKVSGGGSDYPEYVICDCGRKVWYDERGRYAYECVCGWFSGRSD